MGPNDQQQDQQQPEGSGQPENTAPERDGHEFPRATETGGSSTQTGEQDAGSGNIETVDDGRGSGQTQQGQTGFDDGGRENAQRAASASAGESGSWRPSADPAMGDAAITDDHEDTSEQEPGKTGT